MTTYKTINKKTDYFPQRKQVMKYVYEARNIARKYNINHPRIEVRICENEKDCNTNAQVLGVASMDSKTKNIWIMEKAFNRHDLRITVFHEILHTLYNQEHVKGCRLMSPTLSNKWFTDQEITKLFIKYIKTNRS